MKIKDAVVERLKELCDDKGIQYKTLARSAGVSPSAVYSFLKPERRDVGVNLLKKLCDGLDIGIDEFFADDLFRNLLQEIE